MNVDGPLGRRARQDRERSGEPGADFASAGVVVLDVVGRGNVEGGNRREVLRILAPAEIEDRARIAEICRARHRIELAAAEEAPARDRRRIEPEAQRVADISVVEGMETIVHRGASRLPKVVFVRRRNRRASLPASISGAMPIRMEDFVALLDEGALGRIELCVRVMHQRPDDHPTSPAWCEGRSLEVVVLS